MALASHPTILTTATPVHTGADGNNIEGPSTLHSTDFRTCLDHRACQWISRAIRAVRPRRATPAALTGSPVDSIGLRWCAGRMGPCGHPSQQVQASTSALITLVVIAGWVLAPAGPLIERRSVGGEVHIRAGCRRGILACPPATTETGTGSRKVRIRRMWIPGRVPDRTGNGGP